MAFLLKVESIADKLKRSILAVIAEGEDVPCDLKPGRTGGVTTSRVEEAVVFSC
jgi:hypothetical protein